MPAAGIAAALLEAPLVRCEEGADMLDFKRFKIFNYLTKRFNYEN
jgi:hypothetical protein